VQDKQIYFLSDAHLGATVLKNNREREQRLVDFLEEIRPTCAALYLLGDMFDFWFEYKRVIPKGHTRFLGELCRFTDGGIPVHFFTGNHDTWAFSYLHGECGVTLHFENEWITICHKRFLIGHGDGLNPGDKAYTRLRRAFHNRFLQRVFRLLHPDAGIKLANAWSSHSRLQRGDGVQATAYRGDEEEAIVLFCKNILQRQHVDYFVFGHRHFPSDVALSPSSRYINTGDWITHFSYATFDGSEMTLHQAR
jgi:UDP-2,3-diacylglucosamine hydrolase